MSYSKQEGARRYDAWFELNPALFDSEVAAIRQLLPPFENAIEIGVGTGLFASRLGIADGLEPSPAMAQRAAKRGVNVIAGRAEQIPAQDGSYSFVLMVTAFCFLDDAAQALREIHRILEPGGVFILAFIDRDTELGGTYLGKKEDDPYYANARFYSAAEAKKMLQEAGFTVTGERQTVYNFENEPQEVRDGTGAGAFAVIRSEKV